MITENTLRVKIEATGDGQMKAALDGVAQSVEKIDKAQQGQADSAAAAATAGQANATATQAVGESAAEAEARIKAMVQASLERQRVEQAQITASMRSVDTTKVATQTINEQVAAHQKAIAAADAYRERSAAASKAAGNTAGIDTQRDAMHKLLGEIDPTIVSLDKLDKQQAKLAGFKKAGLLSGDDFTRFSQAIDGSRNRITAAGEAMSHFSLNTAQSRRELGYLVKDMATGNFGRFNQSALTLANSSGLLSAAFTGSGLAIGGVVGVLGLFAAEGIKAVNIADEINRALIATGNYSGATVRQIQQLAAQMDAPYGASVQVLTRLTASGRVAGDVLQSAGQAAVDMAYLTGQSVDSAVATIERLARDPTAAVIELNNQFHFLTATQIENIRSLESVGGKADAAKAAIDAMGAVMHQRALQAKQDGPWFTTAWEKWKEGISNIGAGIGDIATLGGKQTEIDKYTAAVNRYREAVKQLDIDRANGRSGFAHDLNVSTAQRAYNNVMSIWNDPAFQRERDQKQVNAVVQGVQRDSEEADATLSRLGVTLDSMKDKQAKVNEAAAALYKKHLAGVNFPGVNFDGPTADLPQGPGWDAIVARLNPKKKVAAGPDLSIDIPVPSLDKTIAGYEKELQAQAKVTVALMDYRQVQEAKLQTAQEAYDLQVASIGMSDREIATERELINIHREADADLQRLNKQRASMTKEQYDAQLSTIKEFENARVEAAATANRRTLEAMGDWRHGMSAALKNYADSAADVAGQTKDLFANAFDGMGDALANFVTTGKGDFSGLVDSIIKDLIRMEARILVSKVLEAVLGAYMGTPAGYNSATPANQVAYDVSQAGNGYATGGRIDGPGTGTSDSILARVSNGENVITASATDYYGQSFMDALNAKQVPRFASGGRVGGGGGGGMGVPEVVVNITNNGQAVQAQQTGARMDGQKMIIDLVLQAVQGDIAKGGGTAQAMQQRFGLRRRGVPVGG